MGGPPERRPCGPGGRRCAGHHVLCQSLAPCRAAPELAAALERCARPPPRPHLASLALARRAAARRCVEGGAEPARPPQVVRTTIEPAHRPRDNSYDAYEYTGHSHTYNSYEIPSAKARALPILAARLALAALAISRPRCIHC